MLPINTQAQANTDKLILDTVRLQGEELIKQSKALEKLMYEFTRQKTKDERVSNRGKASVSTQGPGFFDTSIKDIIDQMLNLGPKKEVKKTFIKPAANKESTNKEKTKGEDQDILKIMLEKFVETSKYQEEMIQHAKTMQMIANITKADINIMKDDFAYVKKSYEDSERDRDREALAEQIAQKMGISPQIEDNPIAAANNSNAEGTQETFAIKMGKAVAENLSRSFATLLTFKDFKQVSEKQTDRLIDALSELNVGEDSGFGLPDIPGVDGVDKGKGKPGKRTPRGSRAPRRMPRGGPKGKIPWGKLALGGAVATIAYEGLTYSSELNADEVPGQQEQMQQQAEERQNQAEKIANDPNIPEGDARKIEAKKHLNDLEKLNSDIKKYGEEEAVSRAEARLNIEQNLRERKDVRDESKRLQSRSRADKELKNRIPVQEVPPQEPLMIPPELKNLSADETPVKTTLQTDLERLSQSAKPEMITSASPIAVQTPNLLQNVSEENKDLIESKQAAAPVTIINNNTNNVGGGGSGESINFAAARPTNSDTSINDFFRSHGRIFA